MERAVLASKTLAHDFRILVDQNGHEFFTFARTIGEGI
jgi:hypothetical protein